MIIQRFKDLLKKEKEVSRDMRIPKHIAITTEGKIIWAKRKDKDISEAYSKSFNIIKDIIKEQVRKDVPIITFYLLSTDVKELEYFSQVIDNYINFFENLTHDEFINKNKIKITLLGKWYDLPGRIIEPAKKMLETTKDYDNFFVNFCMNYSGQDEIVDACKLVARQIKADKIDIESIDKELIKDNIYASYFLPPDIIIKNGIRKCTSGLLLWDTSFSTFFYSKKLWPDFEVSDFKEAIKFYQKN